MRVRSIAVLAAAAALAAAAPAAGATLVVDDDGACAGARFTTIQSALDAARAGDTVRVCDGVYREFVTVPELKAGLKIVAKNQYGATIQAPATDTGQHEELVRLGASKGTLLRGFTIRGPMPVSTGGTSCPRFGVFFFGGDNQAFSSTSAAVDHNRIRDLTCPSRDSVSAIGSDQVADTSLVISDNDIAGYGGAGYVATLGAPDVRIFRNHFTGTPGSTGVVLRHRTRVTDNVIDDNGRFGIVADGFEDQAFLATVSSNVLHRNGAGISMREIGARIEFDLPGLTQVDNNLVLDSVDNGIESTALAGVRFRGNRSLGSGGFDCFEGAGRSQWTGNIGVTDSPATLCKAP